MSNPRPNVGLVIKAASLIAILAAVAATLAVAQHPVAKPRLVPGRDPGGIAVAIIGSGVNYTLPVLAGRLARDGEGDIVGLDVEDRDNRPFDRSTSALSGTTIASLVVAEAPRARLVPVRVRDGDAQSIPGILAFVSLSPARIAVLPAWCLSAPVATEFAKAAAARPEVLLIVAAGDDGASLAGRPELAVLAALPNVLVISAADPAGRRLARSNHGAPVGLMVAAARLKVLDREGKETESEGSVLAAARTAALAARLKARELRLEGAALRTKVMSFAKAGALLDPSDIERDGR